MRPRRRLRRGNEIVAVGLLARQRDEQRPSRDRPGVGCESSHHRSRVAGTSQLGTQHRGDLVDRQCDHGIASAAGQIPMQRGPLLRRHHRIAERQDLAGDLLTELVALAEDRDDITGPPAAAPGGSPSAGRRRRSPRSTDRPGASRRAPRSAPRPESRPGPRSVGCRR